MRLLTSIIVAAGAVSWPTAANAVVVAKDNSTTYLQAPADDFGFRSVGTVFNAVSQFPASGVYLGQGWVISVFHNVTLDKSTFTFGGVTFGGIGYNVDAGTATRLHNPDGTLADLAVFRLTTEPENVPAVSLSGTTPIFNTPLRMMGNGQDRELEETRWSTLRSPWSESPIGTQTGYELVGTRALRWGNNNMDPFAPAYISISSGEYGKVSAFRADFDEISGEAVATPGDSGGGVFSKRLGAWELSGIMFAVGTLQGQPGGTVAYGNITYSADIATYRQEIQDTMASVPEPTALAFLAMSGGFLLRRRRASIR